MLFICGIPLFMAEAGFRNDTLFWLAEEISEASSNKKSCDRTENHESLLLVSILGREHSLYGNVFLLSRLVGGFNEPIGIQYGMNQSEFKNDILGCWLWNGYGLISSLYLLQYRIDFKNMLRCAFEIRARRVIG